jgi:MFS family permease
VYRLTGSTLLVGVVGFAQFTGTVALAPWSGAAADHYDRRQLMIVTQSCSIVVTVVLAVATAAGVANAAVVIVLAGVLGVFSAFTTPAMLSLVPLLVEEREMRSAIALNAATFNVARAIGPVLAAAVIGRYGIATAFAVNAVSYLALIAALLVVQPRPQPDRPPERPKLRESVGVVTRRPELALLLVAIMAVALTSDPLTTLTPGFATELFDRADTWAGVLIGAFGAGAVLAALSAGRERDPHRTLTFSLAGMGAGTLVFALAPGVQVAAAGLFVAGYCYLTSTTTTTSALQLAVDDSQRGRVMAIWSVSFVGVRPFGSLLDGAVATGFGLRHAAVLFSLPALVMSVVLLSWRRRQVA